MRTLEKCRKHPQMPVVIVHSVLHDLGFFYLLNKLHRKKKETFREVNSCLKLKFKTICPILFLFRPFFFVVPWYCLNLCLWSHRLIFRSVNYIWVKFLFLSIAGNYATISNHRHNTMLSKRATQCKLCWKQEIVSTLAVLSALIYWK